MNLSDHIRTVMDFPKPGIGFKDITPLLAHPEAFRECIEQMDAICPPGQHDVIAGIESRGFLFGAALALKQGKPLVPIRKPGKLPWDCLCEEYTLEYGSSALEIHRDSCKPGQRVLLVDDLLATGGTLKAAAKLVQALGAEVSAALCLVDLTFLPGRKMLEEFGLEVKTLIDYTGEE